MRCRPEREQGRQPIGASDPCVFSTVKRRSCSQADQKRSLPSRAGLGSGLAQQARPVFSVARPQLIIFGTSLQNLKHRIAVFDRHVSQVVLILASLIRAFKEFHQHKAPVGPYGSGQVIQNKQIPSKVLTPKINFGCNGLCTDITKVQAFGPYATMSHSAK